jgi:hypothetical protein
MDVGGRKGEGRRRFVLPSSNCGGEPRGEPAPAHHIAGRGAGRSRRPTGRPSRGAGSAHIFVGGVGGGVPVEGADANGVGQAVERHGARRQRECIGAAVGEHHGSAKRRRAEARQSAPAAGESRMKLVLYGRTAPQDFGRPCSPC